MDMGVVTLGIRLGLAAVFATAAVAKLADRPGSRQALEDFGVPAGLRRPLELGLPVVELAVAVLLLAPGTTRWAALGALTLLLCFLAAIGLTLRRGVSPPCHCFGSMHSAPIGVGTLLRTGLFALAAAVLSVAGAPHSGIDLVHRLGSFSVVGAVEAALCLALVVAVVAAVSLFIQMTAQNGRLVLRIEELERRVGAPGGLSEPGPAGLGVGTLAPGFTLDDRDGLPVSLDELRAAGRPVVLVFSDPRCGPCSALLPELARWQAEHVESVTIALITRGPAETNRATGDAAAVRHVLLQRDREVAAAYRSHATPTAVRVEADGRVGSPLVAGAAAIAALVSETARSHPHLAQTPASTPSTAAIAPALGGNMSSARRSGSANDDSAVFARQTTNE
jgi:hypothetical protein